VLGKLLEEHLQIPRRRYHPETTQNEPGQTGNEPRKISRESHGTMSVERPHDTLYKTPQGTITKIH